MLSRPALSCLVLLVLSIREAKICQGLFVLRVASEAGHWLTWTSTMLVIRGRCPGIVEVCVSTIAEAFAVSLSFKASKRRCLPATTPRESQKRPKRALDFFRAVCAAAQQSFNKRRHGLLEFELFLVIRRALFPLLQRWQMGELYSVSHSYLLHKPPSHERPTRPETGRACPLVLRTTGG